MVRNGVDGPQNLYKGLMSVAYGKALGWGVPGWADFYNMYTLMYQMAASAEYSFGMTYGVGIIL